MSDDAQEGTVELYALGDGTIYGLTMVIDGKRRAFNATDVDPREQIRQLERERDAADERFERWSKDAVRYAAQVASLTEALEKIVDRSEKPCGPHEAPLPYDVAWAEQVAIAREALSSVREGDVPETCDSCGSATRLTYSPPHAAKFCSACLEREGDADVR